MIRKIRPVLFPVILLFLAPTIKLSSRAAIPQATEVRPTVDLYGDPLPSGAIARLGTIRFRHGSEIAALAMSPDNKVVVSSGQFSTVFWDLATGKPIRRIAVGDDYSRCEFSQDGKILLVMQLGAVHLVEVETGNILNTYREQKVGGASAALSPDGKTLAVAFDIEQNLVRAGRVKLFDSASSKEIQNFGEHPATINHIRFSKDGKTLLTGSLSSQGLRPKTPSIVKCWDVATGQLLSELVLQKAELLQMALASDGKTVAICENVGRKVGNDFLSPPVELWDLTSKKQLSFESTPNRPLVLAFTPDGKGLAIHNGSRMELWDVASSKQLKSFNMNPNEVATLALALSRDNKSMVSGGRIGTLFHWDVATGKELFTVDTTHGPVVAVAFSPDAKTAATAGQLAHIWDVRSGKKLFTLPNGFTSRHLVFSADGKNLITNGGIYWDVATGKEIARLEPPGPPGTPGLGGPVLSPDGQILACVRGGIFGGEIVLFNAITRKELRRFGNDEKSAGPLIFSGNGKELFSKTAPVYFPTQNKPNVPMILRWEVSTGKLLGKKSDLPNKRVASFGGPTAWIFHVLSPDGRTEAIAYAGGVNLWEMATGKERGKFVAPSGLITCLAFSPNGLYLATGGRDSSVEIWELYK